MPVDVDAAVITNTRLSADYSVLALAAPAIAEAAQPGQFVMLKASRGMDPLLRRPFSIFEVLRDDRAFPTGITVLNKRIGKDMIHDIMIEQIDFLSKSEIRDNALRRKTAPAEPKAEKAEADGGHAEENPAH